MPIAVPHYRAFVGPARHYDVTGALQFTLLVLLGMRETHTLLDIGCGSLRGGRFFIPYLLPGHYHGIEPEAELVHDGLEKELGGGGILAAKAPQFHYSDAFDFGVFECTFDYILAQSIFSHAGQAQIRRCMAEAAEVMDGGSLFVATFLSDIVNHEGDEWTYPGAVGYCLDWLTETAKENGLMLRTINWAHPSRQTWVAMAKESNSRFVRAGEAFINPSVWWVG